MKTRSCDLVWRVGTVDSATPHPDPSGGQAPALQFGTLRPGRAGIEVDWGAHPGSESGTCFRTNRLCWLAPAHQGMKIGCIGWWEISRCHCHNPHLPWIPAPYRGTGQALRGDDECEGIPTDAGMTRPTVVTGTIHYRTNDTHKIGPLSLNSYSSASLLTRPNWKFILA